MNTIEVLRRQFSPGWRMLTGLISSWPDDHWTETLGTEPPAWQHMVHVLMGIEYWISIDGYKVPDFGKPVNTNLGEKSEEILTRTDLITYQQKIHQKMQGYFDALTEEDLLSASPVYAQWTHLDVIIELIRHTQHHVGQLNVLLRQQGYLPETWNYYEPE